jgi:hypothetical protein
MSIALADVDEDRIGFVSTCIGFGCGCRALCHLYLQLPNKASTLSRVCQWQWQPTHPL